jgi:hypothetical protein
MTLNSIPHRPNHCPIGVDLIASRPAVEPAENRRLSRHPANDIGDKLLKR